MNALHRKTFMSLIALLTCLTQSTHATKAVPTPKLTETQMYEFSSLPNKGNITTGFFQCMAKHQDKDPELTCLPAELEFQQSVIKRVYDAYNNSLSAETKKELSNLRTLWTQFYNARCDYVEKHSLQGNPKVNKEKCQLAMILDWRLELDSFMPMESDEE